MRISSIVMAFVALTLCSISAFAEGVSLHQALQRMVDRHPSLKTAALQAERSALDQVRVESQLGWNMGGSAGLGHDVNFIGVPSSTLNVGANLSKKLESGDQLGLNGRYSYEDSELAFGSLPNPSHRTQFDLSYRKPLWQGAGNARYQEGLAKAKYGSQIAELSLLNIRDQLAQQLIDVYFNLILTTARLQNVDQSVARAHRLANHVLKNRKLGLSEDKDILQLEAQLASLESNRAGLEVAKGQLEIRLKQLMWSDKGSSPQVDIANLPKVTKDVNQDVYMAVEKYNPQIKINELRAQIADSQIREARDSKEDKLDTVFSVGMRTADGTSLVGS
ncbi:MAG: TolC family protein, partial [Gammaproteobacteria bacterium]|nr:TolC family protein [Gammaproteobacteria bacterium]